MLKIKYEGDALIINDVMMLKGDLINTSFVTELTDDEVYEEREEYEFLDHSHDTFIFIDKLQTTLLVVISFDDERSWTNYRITLLRRQ